jgi:hypothetical protein
LSIQNAISEMGGLLARVLDRSLSKRSDAGETFRERTAASWEKVSAISARSRATYVNSQILLQKILAPSAESR